MANQRLDQLADMGVVDKANDLLYIVDASDGLTGSRKITFQDFESTLDGDTIPNSKVGNTALVPVANVATLDYDASETIRALTITANSSLVINNPRLSKTITLIVTGLFDLTLPGSCVILSGSHSFLQNNVYTLFCVDATTDKYYVTIRQE